MSAPLTITAAPAGAAAATKAGAAAGGEGFGDALSTVLAGLPAPANAVSAQPPFDADPASAQGAAAGTPQLDPADPAQSPPAIFQLPVTPAAAVALQASEAAPEAGQDATPPAPDPEAPTLTTADPLPGLAGAASAGPGTAEAATAAQSPVVTAASNPGEATVGAAGRAADPGMPAPETRTVPPTPAPGTAPAGTPATAAAAAAAAPTPQPGPGPVRDLRSAPNAAAVPAAASQSTAVQSAVQSGRANGYQLPVPAVAAAENMTPFVPLAPPAVVPVAVPAATPPAAVPVPVPQGFAAQLARPVFTLASAGMGEHSMTVAVNPENLGPVTVQAHISPAGIRVELFAANADGRDVLRQILPDLKRDLAGAGLNASLDLSSGNHPDSRQPDGGPGGRDQFYNRRPAFAYPDGTDSRQLPVNEPTSRAGSLYGADGSLDVMA
jgi:flagellar hook-length control protein FliK